MLVSIGQVIDLKTQFQNFKTVGKLLKKKVGKTESKQLLSNAVYIFSTGHNDFFALLSANSTFPYSDTEYLQMIMGNLTSVLKVINLIWIQTHLFVLFDTELKDIK